MTMLGATAPLIALAHDASADIDLVPRFPTRIIPRRNGSEQRLGLSQVATETATYRLIPRDHAARRRDSALLATLPQRAADRIVRMPRWEDRTILTALASIGDSVIACDTSDRPGFVDGMQVILFRSSSSFEVGEIAVGGVAPGAITLVAPLAQGWAKETVVAPVHAGRVVFPTNLTHWRSRSGALTLGVEFSLRDIAGVGTGGSAVAGVPAVVECSGAVVNHFGRTWVTATVLDAAGNRLPGTGIVWSTSDPVNAPIYPTLDPAIAIVSNPNGVGSFAPWGTVTATLGALVGNGPLYLG